jgi:hypothetical protein
MVMSLAAMVALGAAHAFNNLGLQAELSEVTPPERLGAATGFFQTARFVGAGLAAGLLGLTVANGTSTDRLYRLWIATGLLSVVLLVWSASTAASTRRPAHSKDDLGPPGSERIGVTSGGIDHEPHL